MQNVSKYVHAIKLKVSDTRALLLSLESNLPFVVIGECLHNKEGEIEL